MFCVNSLSVCLVNTSLTCYAAGCSCLPPVVCVDVLRDECAALSCMSLHQPFIRAHLCARSNVLSPLNLSPFHPLLIPGAHTYTQHRLVIWLALWSLHLWCFFFTPSLSAFNLPSLSSFSCSRSLYTRSWPHPAELSIQPLSSWMQIQECDKSVWFLSSHFAVVTESKTLNTALTQPGLFTAPSMQTQPQKCLHTSACAHFHPYHMHIHTYKHTCTQLHWKNLYSLVLVCVWACGFVCVRSITFLRSSVLLPSCRVFLVFPCVFGSLISFDTRSKDYLI